MGLSLEWNLCISTFWKFLGKIVWKNLARSRGKSFSRKLDRVEESNSTVQHFKSSVLLVSLLFFLHADFEILRKGNISLIPFAALVVQFWVWNTSLLDLATIFQGKLSLPVFYQSPPSPSRQLLKIISERSPKEKVSERKFHL